MRRGSDDGWGDNIPIFGGLDKFINLLSDMVDNDKNEVNLSGDIKPQG